jgi:hypothetical protein
MRIAWCCLLLVMGAVAGCVEFPLLKDGAKAPAANTRKEPVTVTADQVTDSNAYEKADALQRELDRTAQHEATAKGSATKVLP